MKVNRNILKKESITKVIDEIQKRTYVREIEYNDIVQQCTMLDVYLDIPKCHKIGVSAEIDIHADTFTAAYRGIPESTQFRVEYKRGGWYVTDIFRARCECRSRRVVLHLTADAEAAIIRRLHQKVNEG